jgi:hypothetical protein
VSRGLNHAQNEARLRRGERENGGAPLLERCLHGLEVADGVKALVGDLLASF